MNRADEWSHRAKYTRAANDLGTVDWLITNMPALLNLVHKRLEEDEHLNNITLKTWDEVACDYLADLGGTSDLQRGIEDTCPHCQQKYFNTKNAHWHDDQHKVAPWADAGFRKVREYLDSVSDTTMICLLKRAAVMAVRSVTIELSYEEVFALRAALDIATDRNTDDLHDPDIADDLESTYRAELVAFARIHKKLEEGMCS